MLRRQKQIRAQVQKLVDAGLFCLAYWLAHWIRSNWLRVEVFGGTPNIEGFDKYAWVLVPVFFAGPFLLGLQGFYNRPLFSSRAQTAWQVFKASMLTLVVVISLLFLMRYPALSRAALILFPTLSFGFVVVKEEMLRGLLRGWLKTSLGQAQLKKRLILVGTPEDTARLKKDFQRNAVEDIEIMAQLNLNEASVEQLVQVLHDSSANGVIISAQHTYFGQVEKAIQACELEGVEAWLLADFFKTQVSQTALDDFNGRPMLVFRSTPPDSWQNVIKQFIDVVGAGVLLVVLSPLLVTVTAWIRLTSPGPVLFKQKRSGLNGRPFTMMKFRTMVSDAEQLKQELAVLNEMSGPVFKLTNDPRVTPVGRFLRRYSIDELPQLINVLRGEMSLVGPRPLPVDETMRFNDMAHRRRLSVKPGLTCLWQVSGRSNVVDFKDWVRLDLEYIDNWSLWLDVKILLRTIPAVLLGTGAR